MQKISNVMCKNYKDIKNKLEIEQALEKSSEDEVD